MGGEAQGLVLDHLEQLEHRGSVEGDAAKHKGIEARPKCVDICGPAPAATAAEQMSSRGWSTARSYMRKENHWYNSAQNVKEPSDEEGWACM